MQDGSKAEPAEVCNTPQHNEGKIKTDQENECAGAEGGTEVWFGGCSSDWTTSEKAGGYTFFCGWVNRQAQEWSPCNLNPSSLITICFS